MPQTLFPQRTSQSSRRTAPAIWARPSVPPAVCRGARVLPARSSHLLVFGGAGDLGRRQIQPALRQFEACIADCAELVDDPRDHHGVAGSVEGQHPFQNWYNMQADGERCWERLRQGAYKHVHLATPPWETAKLVDCLVDCAPALVGVEKPWFPDVETARRVAARMNGHESRFRFIDHFLDRPTTRWLDEQPLQILLDGPITGITGWLLESAEPTSPAMSVGVLADLAVHLVTLTHRLLPGCAIEVTAARAARYDDAPIPAETFVQIEAVGDSVHPVPMVLSAAKGFPAEAAGKMLLIEGADGVLAIDFAREWVELIRDRETRCLFQADETAEDAYVSILRRLTADDRTLGLALDEAIAMLELLEAARQLFAQPLPWYDRETPSTGHGMRHLPVQVRQRP